jgi:glutamyl/glutaminyl-tRNA synthetase
MKQSLEKVKAKIENIEVENWNAEFLKNLLWDWSGEIGRGQVLHPLRTLLSLKDKSPDPFVICEILGKEESLKRLRHAYDKLE